MTNLYELLYLYRIIKNSGRMQMFMIGFLSGVVVVGLAIALVVWQIAKNIDLND